MSPLLKGSDPITVSKNISELMKSGRPQDEAVAIAYRVAGKSKNGHKDKKTKKSK